MSTTHIIKYNKIKANSTAYKKNKTNSNRSINIANTIAYVEDFKITGEEESDRGRVINYVTKHDKCRDTESNDYLITPINCTIKNALSLFIGDERYYHSHKKESCKKSSIPNEAFHLFVSFKGKDVPPKKANAIGVEIARRLVGNEYRAIVSTHTNTENFHDHILINAYNMDGYHKYPDLWNLAYVFRNISNQVALENGLEVLPSIGGFDEASLEPDEKTLFDEANDTRIKNSKQDKNLLDIDKVRKDIENTVQKSKKDFLVEMEKNGYKIRKYYKKDKKTISAITYSKEGQRTIGERLLGKKYKYSNIMNAIVKHDKMHFSVHRSYHNVDLLKLIPSPYYNGTRDKTIGAKKPLLIMLVEFLINVLKFILSGYSFIDRASFRKEEYNKIHELLNDATSVRGLLLKYNIKNIYELRIETNRLFKEYAITQSKINRLKTAGRRYKEVIKALEDVEKYKKEIIEKNIKVDENDFKYPDMEEANVLENAAKLDPMSWEMRSMLFKEINKSGYDMNYPYTIITESRAKEILKYLKEGVGKVPDELTKSLPKRNKENANFKMTKWYYINYTENERKIIKQYKKALTIIKNSGLDNEEKKEKFIKDNEERQTIIKNLISEQEKAKEKLTDYNKMKKTVEGAIYEKIKPFIDEKNVEKINEGIKQIKNSDKNEAIYDYVRNIINSNIVKEYLVKKEEGIVPPIEIIELIKAKNEIEGKDESPYYYSKETIINKYINFFRDETKQKESAKQEKKTFTEISKAEKLLSKEEMVKRNAEMYEGETKEPEEQKFDVDMIKKNVDAAAEVRNEQIEDRTIKKDRDGRRF